MFKPSTCLLAASVLLVVSMGMGVESIGEQKLNRKLSARLIPDPQDKQAQTEVANESEDPELAHESVAHNVADNSTDHHNSTGFEVDYSDAHRDHELDNSDIEERMKLLFPSIDADGDGNITLKELEHWHHQVGMNSSVQQTHLDFVETDANKDGIVTMPEYLTSNYPIYESYEMSSPNPKKLADDASEEERMMYEEVRNDVAAFVLADKNGDGLDEKEFFHARHPEESGDERLYQHLLDTTVRDADGDDDGKLSMQEFHDNLWVELKPWDDLRDDGSYKFDENATLEDDSEWDAKDKQKAQEKFKELDKNSDGQLEAHELRSELKVLHPSEADFAKQMAGDVIENADQNKDGNLTLTEVLANPYILFSSSMTGEDDYDAYRDEF
mmetsp:Transcript_49183/g.93942  ORF Transcript_49183/g.93942 Transcript_49183/m.93942 type:complete len:385 (-) Transcript_49183:213-1367(-)